jgi:hypothetical protein
VRLIGREIRYILPWPDTMQYGKWRFGDTCCTHFQSLPVDGSSRFLRNFGVIYRIPSVRTAYLSAKSAVDLLQAG